MDHFCDCSELSPHVGKISAGVREERMSGIEILDRGDRDKLSVERRRFVIIGITLTQYSEHLTFKKTKKAKFIQLQMQESFS